MVTAAPTLEFMKNLVRVDFEVLVGVHLVCIGSGKSLLACSRGVCSIYVVRTQLVLKEVFG
jgi:hypothetical protein